MGLQKVSEANEIMVGSYYLVPALRSMFWKYPIPIIGPLHEDREIIKFPDEHYHVDWRFASEDYIEASGGWSPSTAGNYPLFLSRPVSVQNVATNVEYRRMKCKRVQPEFPAVAWIHDLEHAYMDATLKNSICPHRGFAIQNAIDPQSPELPSNLKVCPGHGLQWDTVTGKLAPRMCNISCPKRQRNLL